MVWRIPKLTPMVRFCGVHAQMRSASKPRLPPVTGKGHRISTRNYRNIFLNFKKAVDSCKDCVLMKMSNLCSACLHSKQLHILFTWARQFYFKSEFRVFSARACRPHFTKYALTSPPAVPTQVAIEATSLIQLLRPIFGHNNHNKFINNYVCIWLIILKIQLICQIKLRLMPKWGKPGLNT